MKRICAITGAVAAAIMVAGCGAHPDAAACKTAMRAEFAAAITNGTKGKEPAACKGLPAKELQRLAAEILSGK